MSAPAGAERRGARIVGVLGGMGPEATVELMRRVIALTPARDDADHVHLIVDQNPAVPSRIAALIDGTGESPAPTLAAMARRLTGMGAGALAMPCNTAHHYLGAVQDAAGDARVLDMPALAAGALSGARRVGVLASTAVRDVALYENALAAHGATTLWPEAQPAVLDAIRAVKRGETARARETLASAAAVLAEDGADAILIACTEFSAVLGDDPAAALDTRLRVVDALDALARVVVEWARRGAARDAA